MNKYNKQTLIIKKNYNQSQKKRRKEDNSVGGTDCIDIRTISNILYEEPIILGEDGLTERERYKQQLYEFNRNFLRTGIIQWKRSQPSETIHIQEPGWEFVHRKTASHNNYLKYILDEIPENITIYKNDEWIRSDLAGLYTEAISLLDIKELGKESCTNYWIDPRLLGSEWLGLFEKTVGADKINNDIKHPGMPSDNLY